MLRIPWLAVLETLAVIAGLAILAVAALLWRLSLGPIDLGFARPWLAQALRDSGQDFEIKAGRLALEWEGAGKPVLLGLQDMHLVRPDGRSMLSVAQAGASLSLARLALGQIEPRAIILDGPALRLVRGEDNRLTLGMAQKEEPPPAAGAPQEDRARQAADIGAWLWRLTAPDKAVRESLPAFLRSLRRVEIRNARLMIEDRVNGVSWFLPRSDFAILRAPDSLSAQMSFLLPGDARPFVLSLGARQESDGSALALDLALDGFNPRLIADRFGALAFLSRQDVRIDVRGAALLGPDMTLQAASASARAGAASLYLPQAYSRPVPLDFLEAQATYDPATHALDLPHVSLGLAGVTVEMNGRVDLAAQDLSARLKVTGDVPTEKVQAVWPDALPGDNSSAWIHHRIAGGKFSAVEASLAAGRDPATGSVDLKEFIATFAFEGVGVDYRPPLYPVRDAAGTGRFDVAGNQLVLKGTRATIKDMRASGITAAFDDLLTAGKGMADIEFDLSGPLPTALAYIALEPIRLGGRLPVDPKAARGDAALHVRIAFPTIKHLLAEQVDVKVKGTVANAFLPRLVAGLDIEGGPLALETFDGYFKVGGKGTLAGRPIEMDWTQYMALAKAPFAAQARARLAADKGLRDHFNIALDDYLSGTVPVDLVYTENKDDTATVDVKADLAPARVTIGPFLYDKPPGAPASASLRLFLRGGKAQQVEDLTVAGPDLDLSGGALTFAPEPGGGSALRKGRFASFRLGQTGAQFAFESDGPGKTLSLTMEGASLDARPFLDESYRKQRAVARGPEGAARQEGASRPLSIAVRAARMRTTGEEKVDSARAALEIDSNGILTQLDFSARAGAGDLTMRFAPEADGQRTLRIDAGDAGATLRAFNIYEKVRGGTLTVYGRPAGNSAQGDISGTVRLENFRVVNAPVLASLLSAMSIPGLLQSLSTDGLAFTRAESGFDWVRTQGRSAYQFRDGRTSGNSLGLTFMGTVDKVRGTVDLSGTIAPMSEINSLIGGIPLIGDILAGGKDGAIIAATYAIKGDADNPRVLVNPLAALTPGILRRLLFEDQAPRAPEAAPAPRRERGGLNR